MSGWFTTGTFWVGAGWGFCCGTLAVYHWLAKPMARLLGFDTDGSAVSEKEVPNV